MTFPDLHPWNLTPTQAVALQRELAGRVELHDALPEPVRLVAGVDVSSARFGSAVHAAVVIYDLAAAGVIEVATATADAAFPYIPGLLSFRELPVVLGACRRLQAIPEVVLVDGQGIAHPRRLGIASHLGLWLGLPTVGCAKSRLCGEHGEVGTQRGDCVPLWLEGVEVGRVVRTRDRVRPLYVSPGHLISIDRAVQVVLACGCGYRLPEPTRQAHIESNRLRILGLEARGWRLEADSLCYCHSPVPVINQRTLTDNLPTPVISASTESPLTSGPTPEGVPVSRMSPASRVK